MFGSEAALRVPGSPFVPVRVVWADSPVLATSPGSKGLGAPEVQEIGSVRSSEEHQEVRFNKEGRTLIATQGHSEAGEAAVSPFVLETKSLTKET